MIREGRRIADKTNTKLYIVNIQRKSEWGKKFSRELEHMLMTSKKLDAKMLVYFSDNPVEILNDYISRNNVNHIVLTNNGINLIALEELLHAKSREIEIHICKCK